MGKKDHHVENDEVLSVSFIMAGEIAVVKTFGVAHNAIDK